MEVVPGRWNHLQDTGVHDDALRKGELTFKSWSAGELICVFKDLIHLNSIGSSGK